MSTFNINGPVSGSSFGDNGQVHNYGSDATGAVAMAAQLVRVLREAQAAQGAVEQAVIVHGELESAQREGRGPDRGRIRAALDVIQPYVAVGSGGLALVEGITRFIG
ncbi:hypothetical protein [Streptomyces sp. NPDC056144]|uniref:hypothetical protein n=1 Tax=unclassified Streptomyces TaxID=2593676 RepID=UPI0035D5A8B1